MLKNLPQPSAAQYLNCDEHDGFSKIFPHAVNVANRPKQHSQHSQDPQALHALFNLGDEEIELFEERAAIMEYDGGLTRQAAESKALMIVLNSKIR